MTDNLALTNSGLVRLLTWLSPSFPVGAFTYSHGLEWSVETGVIADRETFEIWLRGLVEFGGPWTDAVLFAHAFRLAQGQSDEGLVDLNDFAVSLAPTSERELETTAQGAAFLKAVEKVGDPETCHVLRESGKKVAYPVAVAAAAAGTQIDLNAALTATLHASIANLISAGVRLIPLGQSDGLSLLHALDPVILEVARKAQEAELLDVGGCALLSDIASARHETQYTRLFRS